MKLKDLPKEELPRERLLKYGPSNLSNEELISILIRTGSKDSNVKELSNQILSKIKSIESLKEISVSELSNIKGVGQTKALTIIAAIELGKRVANMNYTPKVSLLNSKMVNDYFAHLISASKQENFLVILLDNKSRVISHQIMFKGTSTSSLVDIKTILNYALRENAYALVVMHNHPSGVLEPSDADIKLTNRLNEACALINIPLVDHIITNGLKYFSFYEAQDEINT